MTLHQLNTLSDGFSKTPKMPVLFLGHGSPMNAIEENIFVQGFRNVSKQIPKPNAILCISAHWLTNGSFVTAMDLPKTFHDFYGFPKALFDVQYPAPGSPELAKETTELLLPALVEEDHSWGLDHGAWSVIRHLYPHADIPVIQLSIDYSKPMQYHFELAQRLQKLREKGILIIGSGNIVHNLSMIDWQNINTVGSGWDWAIEAREKTNQWIMDGDFRNIVNYHQHGNALQKAVPTPDHFAPLVYALALKSPNDEMVLFNDELIGGSLSMTSVKIG